MADNNKYIATWSKDLTSFSSPVTYSSDDIGHGTLPSSGLIECIVSIWICNSSDRTYEATVTHSTPTPPSDNFGMDFILPPMSTVVFKGAAEKMVSGNNITFILDNNQQTAPSAGEVVANVTVEITEELT